MAEIIASQKSVNVTFSLDPANNVIGSLSLLEMAEGFSGLGDWVYQTTDTLTPEQLHTNQLVLHDAYVHVAEGSWSSFPEWIEDLAAQDADEMRDHALQVWLSRVGKKVSGELPTPSALIADRAAYLSLTKEFAGIKGEPFDQPFWEEIYGLLNDPDARKNMIVRRMMKTNGSIMLR